MFVTTENRDEVIMIAMEKIRFLPCKILKRMGLNCTRVRQGKKVRYKTAVRILQCLSRKKD
jgi:hypothetical protein